MNKLMQPFLLFGASNLTLSFPRIIAALEKKFQSELKIFAAHGHGRSLGLPSHVLHRSLPGLIQTQIWEYYDRTTTEQAESKKPLGLVTDIGNDLVYGRSPEQILEWLDTLLSQLQQRDADIIVTTLPAASLSRLPAWRFYLVKNFFFPFTPLSYEGMQNGFQTINNALPELAQKYNCKLLSPQSDWYGFDPIHILPQKRPEAWSKIFESWPLDKIDPEDFEISWSHIVRLWRLKSVDRKSFGMVSDSKQPCYKSQNGAEVYLF